MPMLHISTVIASESEAILRACSGGCHAVAKVIQKITDYPRLAMRAIRKKGCGFSTALWITMLEQTRNITVVLPGHGYGHDCLCR